MSGTTRKAAQLLQAPWPGNVRQLINLAERAVLQSRRGQGTIASLLMNDHEDMQPVMTTDGDDVAALVQSLGLTTTQAETLGTVRHVFSHRKLTLTVVRVSARGEPTGTGPYDEVRWVPEEAPEVALSRLAHKVLELASAQQVALPLAAAGTVTVEGT